MMAFSVTLSSSTSPPTMSSAEAGPSRSGAESRAAQEARLAEHFPGRAEAVATLLDVLCTVSACVPHWAAARHADALPQPDTPLPAAVHIHAASSSRASELLSHLLAGATATRISSLDPLQQPTCALLYAHLLADLAPASAARPEALDTLVAALAPALQEQRALVVVQNAERMRDVWEESIGEAVWGLAELVSSPSGPLRCLASWRVLRCAPLSYARMAVSASSRCPACPWRRSARRAAVEQCWDRERPSCCACQHCVATVRLAHCSSLVHADASC
jgi:hypothetical protein